VSVLASFTAVWAFGFTLNTMSLLGLSLAIGILIDDAIVVRENIVRHVEMGKDHYTAAREGTDEIGLAVAATTFSIVCVFVPIAFMGSLAEQWFAPFALTIACSVLVSLFVSFSLDPMLSAYWPDPHVPENEKWWITRMLDRFNRWFDHQAHRYRGVIGWALDHRLFIVMLALGMFLGALQIPATGILGFAVVVGLALAASVIAPMIKLGRGRTGGIATGVARTAGVLLCVVGGLRLAGVMPVVFKLGGEFFPPTTARSSSWRSTLRPAPTWPTRR
jgi:HAE1 family hydrophobic/amphiphilic exporter-1